MEYISYSIEDTKKLANVVAMYASKGFILLKGSLAAGKTTFTKYLAKALKIKQIVNSPTFVIMNQYQIADKPFNLVHIDAYRLSSEEDFGMFTEAFTDNLNVIEWYEGLLDVINSENILVLELKYIDENTRNIDISGTGSMYNKTIKYLQGN